MPRTAAFAITLLAAAGIAGCTYQAPVSASKAASASIVPAKRSSAVASYYIAPELAALQGSASAGPCSYPIAIGGAVAESLEAATLAAFPAGAHRTTEDAPAAGAGRHLSFAGDSFTPDVNLDTRWFSVGSDARVDLAVRVKVTDPAGTLLWNGLITGSGAGHSESAGGCEHGSRALTSAGNQAVRQLAEDYVASLINAGQL